MCSAWVFRLSNGALCPGKIVLKIRESLRNYEERDKGFNNCELNNHFYNNYVLLLS